METLAATKVDAPKITQLTLEPRDRLLLGVGEAVRLRVYASGVDVTDVATITVRNPNAAVVDNGVLTPQAALSSVVEAQYQGARSNPVPFTAIEPAFVSGYGQGNRHIEFALPTGFSLTNAERITFAYNGTANVRVFSKQGASYAYGAISDTVALDGSGVASIAISPWNRDESWDARSIGLEVDGDFEVANLSVLRPFVYGVNLAWLDGAYGHDFGPTQHHPGWGVAYNPNHVDELLSMSDEMGFKLWRVWVFEACEGLVKVDGIVTGVHETFWANFDDFIFTRLPKHNVKVYFMLVGAAHMNECPDPSVLRPGTAQRAFLDQAMLPFVQRYAQSPWVWGFDLTNEAEGHVQGSTGNYTSTGLNWEQMRSFLQQAASELKNAAPRVLVSASSGWHNHENVAAGRFSRLGFSHLDFHNYADDGSLVSYASLQRHERVLVGEAGQATHTWNNAVHLQANIKMVRSAAAQSYWGILPWAIEYPGYNNEYSMFEQSSTYGHLVPRPALQALRDWAATRTDLGP